MKAGDLVLFEETGTVATILHVYRSKSPDPTSGYVDLYVGDGSLDNTHSPNGLTSMSIGMIQRTARVFNESR